MVDSEGFRRAGLPTALADEIEAWMQAHPEFGHRSLSGFATRACQDLLGRLRKEAYYQLMMNRDAPGAGDRDDPDVSLD